MRYSDLAGKEIIDIDAGLRLGVVNDTDLVIDAEAGKVVAIVIPARGRWWHRRELEIPWHGIKKIGVDLIIVDLSTAIDAEGPARQQVRLRRPSRPSDFGDDRPSRRNGEDLRRRRRD